jgi:hypothetical protein
MWLYMRRYNYLNQSGLDGRATYNIRSRRKIHNYSRPRGGLGVLGKRELKFVLKKQGVWMWTRSTNSGKNIMMDSCQHESINGRKFIESLLIVTFPMICFTFVFIEGNKLFVNLLISSSVIKCVSFT